MKAQFKNKERIWYALDWNTGHLARLGDCGDYDSAEEIAKDAGVDPVWIVSDDYAEQWFKVLAQDLEEI